MNIELYNTLAGKSSVIKTKYADRVVLVTTTFSPSIDDMRGRLALKTCHMARECDYSIIVVDGSPSQEFKQALRETGATVIDQKEFGMGASRRETLNAGVAYDAEVVVWLEPEKHPLVPLLDVCIELFECILCCLVHRGRLYHRATCVGQKASAR